MRALRNGRRRMHRSTSWVLLAALVALVAGVATVSALYEEQAGTFDWYREQLGGPVNGVVWPNANDLGSSSTVPGSRVRGTALVGTGAGVLALLKVKTGAIVWRQVLPEGDAVQVLAFDRATAVTVSGAGRLVRAWSVGDGALLWESGTHTAKTDAPTTGVDAAEATPEWRTFDAVLFGSKGSRTASLYRGVVSVVSTESGGAPLWTWTAPRGVTAHRLLTAPGASSDLLYVVSSADGSFTSALTITALNTKGEVVSEKRVDAFADATSVAVLEHSGAVVLAGSGAVRVVRVADASVHSADYNNLLSSEQQTDVAAGDAVHVTRTSGVVRQWVTLSTNKNRAVLKVDDKSGAVMRVFSAPTSTAKAVTLSGALDSDGKAVVLRAVVVSGSSKDGSGAALTVDAVDPVSGASTAVLVKGAPFAQRGTVRALFGAALDGKQLAALVVGTDDSVSAVVASNNRGSGSSNNEVAFTRDEALGHIVAVEFVELPIAHAFGNAGFPSLAQRIVPQVKLLLQSMQQWANTLHTLITTRRLSFPDTKSSQDVDAFGFRKLVVCLTRSGALVALPTEAAERGNGAGATPAWRTLLPGVGTASATGGAAAVWRLYRVAPHTVAVVSRADTSAVLHLVDALTGRVLSTQRLPYAVADAFVLPYTVPAADATVAVAESSDDDTQPQQHALLFVDGRRIAHVVPNTPASLRAFRGVRAQLHYHVVDAAASLVQGYAVADRSVDAGAFETDVTWTHAFAADVESIAAVAGRQGEAIHTAVRMITTNDDGPKMLYKYLNPHLLAVATVRTASAANTAARPVLPKKTSTDPCVVVYLVDSVSGAVVEKLVHRGATGPVTLAQSEHVVVAHYWNAAAHTYEVSVVELYQDRDSSREEDASFSSFAAPVPQIMQQTYTLRTGVKAIAATRTHRGITQKDFLFALTSDQLLSVAKHFLDPRRPYDEPTQAERDDALVPYMPELPADPVFVVSHTRTVAHLKHIVTTHARLESTSLVLAYGLDVFYTRVTPSQTFDLLNEDFHYAMLLLTVAAVAVPIVITRRWAKQKELASAWK